MWRKAKKDNFRCSLKIFFIIIFFTTKDRKITEASCQAVFHWIVSLSVAAAITFPNQFWLFSFLVFLFYSLLRFSHTTFLLFKEKQISCHSPSLPISERGFVSVYVCLLFPSKIMEQRRKKRRITYPSERLLSKHQSTTFTNKLKRKEIVEWKEREREKTKRAQRESEKRQPSAPKSNKN